MNDPHSPVSISSPSTIRRDRADDLDGSAVPAQDGQPAGGPAEPEGHRDERQAQAGAVEDDEGQSPPGRPAPVRGAGQGQHTDQRRAQADGPAQREHGAQQRGSQVPARRAQVQPALGLQGRINPSMATPITMVIAPPTRISVSVLVSTARDRPTTTTDWARNTTVKPSTNRQVASTARVRTPLGIFAVTFVRTPDAAARTPQPRTRTPDAAVPDAGGAVAATADSAPTREAR